MTSNKSRDDHPAGRKLYTYETAPARLNEILGGDVFTMKMLKRRVETGRAEHLKIGHMVRFTDGQLEALAESFVVKAVR